MGTSQHLGRTKVQMGTCPILHILTQHQRAKRGTSPIAYNYYGPAQAQKHTDIDVSPWGKWGNTPKGWVWSDWFN